MSSDLAQIRNFSIIASPADVRSGDPGSCRAESYRQGEDPSFAQAGDCQVLWGGVTRKNKLLDKQREGKKRMKRVGQVDPFLALLQVR